MDTHARIGWANSDWWLAAIVPGAFFAFEAVAVTSFETLRAPNMGPVLQLGLWLGFYGVWVLVPRVIWGLVPDDPLDLADEAWRAAIKQLAGLAVLFGGLHLAMLTVILRMMHAPEGGQFSDYVYSYGETLLGRAPIWLLAFAGAAIVIAIFKPRRACTAPPPARIELRDRGKTRLVEIRDIVWVQASGNYVEYHMVDGVVLARQSLREVGDLLGGAGFLASHRSALVNAGHVTAIRTGGEQESYRIVLSNGEEAPLSRRNLSTFRTAVMQSASLD